MNSNKVNPFNRPSPFKYSQQPISTTSYSYSNTNRILQSQVKPGLSGMSGIGSSRNIYSNDIYDIGPSINQSSTNAGYGGIISQPISINNTNLGMKQNPFKRASLLNNTNTSYNAGYSIQQDSYSRDYGGLGTRINSRPSLMSNMNIGTNRNYDNDYNIGSTTDNYEHLRYKPSSKYDEDRTYSPVKYTPAVPPSLPNPNLNTNLNTKYNNFTNPPPPPPPPSSSYNYNNYVSTTDKSDTNSVYTYINNLIDDNKSQYSSNANQLKGINNDAIYGNSPTIKDYSHLQYKPNSKKQKEVTNVSYTNGLDKYKYKYEKEKQRENSKENQQQLISSNKYNKYVINNEEEVMYDSGNRDKDKYIYQPLSAHHIYTQGDLRNNMKGDLDRTNSLQKYKRQQQNLGKKYQFEDYHEQEDDNQDDYMQNSNKYNKNIYNKYSNNDNNMMKNTKNNNKMFDDDDLQYNFNRKQSFEDELQRQSDKKYDSYNTNYVNNKNKINSQENLQQYQSPQFGKLASLTSNLAHNAINNQNYSNNYNTNSNLSHGHNYSNNNRNNDIVRFDDDQQHYHNSYGYQSNKYKKQQKRPQIQNYPNPILTHKQSIPTSQIKNKNSNKDAFPNRFQFRDMEFVRVPCVAE